MMHVYEELFYSNVHVQIVIKLIVRYILYKIN